MCVCVCMCVCMSECVHACMRVHVHMIYYLCFVSIQKYSNRWDVLCTVIMAYSRAPIVTYWTPPIGYPVYICSLVELC